jgi:hypothetical protein
MSLRDEVGECHLFKNRDMPIYKLTHGHKYLCKIKWHNKIPQTPRWKEDLAECAKVEEACVPFASLAVTRENGRYDPEQVVSPGKERK